MSSPNDWWADAWCGEPRVLESVDFDAEPDTDDHGRITGESTNQARAKAVCEHCPVRERCLEAATEAESMSNNGDLFGIFGGLTPADRVEVRRQARRTRD